jgi:hypothetical protein
VEEGTGWIVFQRWGATPDTDGDGHLKELTHAVDLIRQAALDGDVRVWGKVNRTGPYLEIPREFWADHYIDHVTVYMPSDAYPTATRCEHKHPEARYIELMVSRTEFEKAWPTPPRILWI